MFQGDPAWPNPMEKQHDEFFDKGFKNRKVYLNVGKNSMVD